MNISVLNTSVNISVDINTEAAVNAIATNAATALYNVTKHILNRAVEDSQKLINAGRTTREVADAVIQSTAIRAEITIEDKIVAPIRQVKNSVTMPVAKAWNIALDSITDYLETTPVKAVPVAESFPISQVSLNEAMPEGRSSTIAEEVLTDSREDVFSEEWGNKAIEAARNGHVLVGDQVITEDGIANAIAVTEAVEELKPKASGLPAMIREEVAKQ